MKIKLMTLGQQMPSWVNEATQEYTKRLSAINFELVEIPLLKRTKESELSKILQQEAKLTLQQIKATDHFVALERTGTIWSTEQLSKHLQQWQFNGQDVVLLIGGPEGVATEVLNRANQKWSLSHLTLPHPLARILVVEQIYRAFTILQGHPYHK